jgi:hypothetical protein
MALQKQSTWGTLLSQFNDWTPRIEEQNSWTELPMPSDIIERVHTLAQWSKADIGLNFAWQDGSEISDELEDQLDHAIDDDDSDYEPPDDKMEDEDDDLSYNSVDNQPIEPPTIAGVNQEQ